MAYSRTWECRIANLRLAICLVLFLLSAACLPARQRILWTDNYFGNGSTLDSISRYIGRIGQENIEALDDTTSSLKTPEPAPQPPPVKKKPVLAISTNIPYDITYFPKYGFTSIPSFSLEYYPSNYGHWTFGADLEIPMWQHWKEHRFLQIQNLTLNTRYYFKRGNYHGLYVLGNINGARYGLGWDGKGWVGEGLGISVGVGYKLTIYKRLFLDAGIAVGYFYSRYDPYEYGFDATQRYYYDYVGVPEEFVRRNHALNWFGPTRVWISIGIDLFSRKVRK